jgi:hypothetical protein
VAAVGSSAGWHTEDMASEQPTAHGTEPGRFLRASRTGVIPPRRT